ncbi:MAG: metallophosphoesterase, partial [Candidatus Zixiibacteriota bacterium]
CYFVTDLHGSIEKYNKLYDLLIKDTPDRLFMGGDILPSGLAAISMKNFAHEDFINDFMVEKFLEVKSKLKEKSPIIYLILGNDDGRMKESVMQEAASRGIWNYIHNKKILDGMFSIYGYSFIPPSPYLLKDWERYDVSRYTDPGAISPEDGKYSYPISDRDKKYRTIAKDLEKLTGGDNLDKAIMLFHTPPYQTKLDRAALDNKMIDYVPLDVYVGSIAVRKFIEARQPLITLHGHVHESARMTGAWVDKIGETYCFSAAHDGNELAVIKFNPEDPNKAEKLLI